MLNRSVSGKEYYCNILFREGYNVDNKIVFYNLLFRKIILELKIQGNVHTYLKMQLFVPK